MTFEEALAQTMSIAGILVVAELLSWLCLQTRFRQILEGARIVDRLVAKLLQRLSGERRAPARCAIEDGGLLLAKSGIVVWAHARGCPGVPHCLGVGSGPESMPVSVAVVCDELYVRSALGHATLAAMGQN